MQIQRQDLKCVGSLSSFIRQSCCQTVIILIIIKCVDLHNSNSEVIMGEKAADNGAHSIMTLRLVNVVVVLTREKTPKKRPLPEVGNPQAADSDAQMKIPTDKLPLVVGLSSW